MYSAIYGTNTVRQMLEGKNVKRAINAHMTTLIVLFNMYAMHLFIDTQDISSCIDKLDGDTNTTEVVQNITNIASHERLVKIEQLDARQKSFCF